MSDKQTLNSFGANLSQLFEKRTVDIVSSMAFKFFAIFSDYNMK